MNYYCIGHFIEAGVSHFLATKKTNLLGKAIKAANLIVKDFNPISAINCPGHQEIEIALLKLYQITNERKYLVTARQFLEKRGACRFFGIKLLQNLISHRSRNKHIKRLNNQENSKEMGFDFSENIQENEPPFLALRSFFAFISGKYHQQHKAFLKQVSPVGHAVRWVYMMYATAILNNIEHSTNLEKLSKMSWGNLINKKMYITGGIGSLPVIEGFGKDYELNNEFSYSETCAAIGSIFWNNELLKTFKYAPYADMVERQLYNAALVGISQDGKKFFYRNPLESAGNLERRPWFSTACCPSNVSRLWADIHKYIYLETDEALYINQYIGNLAEFDKKKTKIELESAFPWNGQVRLKISNSKSLKIRLRIPGWAETWKIVVNGSLHSENKLRKKNKSIYTEIMKSAIFVEIKLSPGENQIINIDFPHEYSN